MAFKSQAQKRRFAEMLKKGEITKTVYDDWDKDTPKQLPERIKPKAEPKKRK